MIVAKARIDDAAIFVDHHFLVERGAEGLGHAALDLAAALRGIADATGVGGLHTFENFDLACALVHGDAKSTACRLNYRELRSFCRPRPPCAQSVQTAEPAAADNGILIQHTRAG